MKRGSTLIYYFIFFKNTTESASFLACSTWLPLSQARLKNAIRLSFLASIIADFLASVNQK